MHTSQHALHDAVQLQWMLDGVGGGGGWMNILGIFNMLWNKFEINKPIVAGSVCFTEYLRVIFKIVASKHLYYHISFKVRRHVDRKT